MPDAPAEAAALAAEEDISAHTSASRARLEIAVVGLAGLSVALTQTVLVPLLGTLPEELDTTPNTVSWLLTSTLIVGSVAIPLFGRLGDMFGKRLMMLVALSALIIGSVVAALAGDNIAMLLLGRCIQGMSGTAISLGISLMASMLPHDKRPGAIALISAMLGVGSALGGPLGGFVGEHADFHLLFWIAAASGVVTFLGVLFIVPEAPTRSGGRVDILGAVLLSGALVALLLPLAQASKWGWDDPWTIGLLVTSAVTTVLFGVWQSKARNPLVDLVALKRKPIVLTNVASLLFGSALFASLIATTTYVEAPVETGYGFGSSTLEGAMTMLPMGIAMLALTPVSARLITNWGAHYTLALGAGIVSLGWVSRLLYTSEIWMIAAATGIIGIGTAVAYAAMPALINANTPHSELAAANSLNTLARALGSSLASAAGGTILASKVMNIGGYDLPTEAAFQTLFVICAIAGLLALVIALRIPKGSDPTEF